MLNFDYYAPTKVVFGKDAQMRCAGLVKECGGTRVFLLYGGGSAVRSGLLGRVTASLTGCGLRWYTKGGIQPNPVLRFVCETLEEYRDKEIDFILGVGGGSVLDTAKALAAGLPRPEVPVWDYYSGKEKPITAIPVGAVLTIAAAGSETSDSTVLTNEATQEKRGFNAEWNRPRFAILNPELTYTVSPFQTGCGAVDIMMHTLERYFSIGENTPLSDRIAEGVLKTVIPAGKAALENPNDYEARASIMWAGTISHNDLTGLGRDVFMAVHQMEHELSGMDEKIAHGAGLSALWASWARYVYKDDVSRFAQYAVNVWNIEMDFEHPEKTALAGIQATEDYFKSLDMPVSLRELNVDPASFEELAEKCTNYGKRTLAGIKVLDKPDIIEIYKMAY